MPNARIDVLYAVPGSEELVARSLADWVPAATWVGRFVDPGRPDRLVLVQLGPGTLMGPPLHDVPLLGDLGEAFAGPAEIAGDPPMGGEASLSIWAGTDEEIEVPVGAFAIIVRGEDATAAFMAGPPPDMKDRPRWTYLLTAW